ncbi:MAG: acyl-CoA synthetase, partial [Acidobacteriota bacterium]|nr:acyl-CoA synthetase [Acidobacteriota bacterium]
MHWNPKFNAATCIVDRHIPERRAGNSAVECGEERVSYQQLYDRTNRAGNVLRRLGVKPGERVLMLLP